MTLQHAIEALVFASPKTITTKEIVAALRAAGEGSEDAHAQEFAAAKEDEVIAALEAIAAELIATGRAFQLVEKVNGWTLVSDPACAPWVRQLYPEAKPTRLTGPQLETLAIIAYRQPVTRADCEAVRGVAVDGVMQVLLDRGLVKIAGRAEVPGRPLLYSTTEYFLQHFGLKTTDELPNASELKRVALPAAPEPEPAAAEAPERVATGSSESAATSTGEPAVPDEASAPDAPAPDGVQPAALESAQSPAALESRETSESAAEPEAPDSIGPAAPDALDETHDTTLEPTAPKPEHDAPDETAGTETETPPPSSN